MNSLRKLWQKGCLFSKLTLSLIPLRSLWEIWALANVLIIILLVAASIWRPDLRVNLGLAILEMYLGPLPHCNPHNI